MYRTHNCGELTTANLDQQVTLSGWVQRTRDLGELVFIDLRDRYGITQLALKKEHNPELFKDARGLGREFVVQASGKVVKRESANANLSTGEIELSLEKLTVLNAAKT